MRRTTEFANGILNSVSAHIAVVDRMGKIVTVNEAWNRFAQRNGSPPTGLVGVGANYLDVCRLAEARGDVLAREARLGIESVMREEQPHCSIEYPCHSPLENRWFMMHVSRMPESGNVVISHEDITARKLAEDTLRLSHDDLEHRVRERTVELEQRNVQLHREIAEREKIQHQLRKAAKVFGSLGVTVGDFRLFLW